MGNMASKKFLIETYGCQMNEAESASLVSILKSYGWEETREADKADAVILNTCSVRETAENRIWGRLGFYKHEKSKRNFKLTVMGCMAQRIQEKLMKKVPEIDLVVGNFEKHKIALYLDEVLEKNLRFSATKTADYSFFNNHYSGSFKTFIPIMHGCNNFCSYCIVPYVRGREVSRDPQLIIEEIRNLTELGVVEITLLGQNVNSYRFETNGKYVDFPRILELVAENTPENTWIRFLTSHPKDLSKRVMELIEKEDKICRHIHLPVQHGSNRILKSMNRGYTREDYLNLVERIREKISDISITTDILIGYPGEEDEDLELTLKLMESANFDDAFIYRYNPREGTPAFKLADPIPYEKKIERMNRVFELQKRLSRKNREKRLGRNAKVLAEQVSKKNRGEILGRTEWNEMVVFEGNDDMIGRFVEVKLESLSGNTYRGRIV